MEWNKLFFLDSEISPQQIHDSPQQIHDDTV